jgi:signal transduction histidine kinase
MKALLTSVYRRLRGHLNWNGFLTILIVGWIVCLHRVALDSRLVMNLYYLAIAGACYLLAKRRVPVHVTFVLITAVGTIFAAMYFSHRTTAHEPLDPVRDIVTWGALLVLFWRLGQEMYRCQCIQHDKDVQRDLQEAVLSARAAALTCAAHELRTPVAAIVGCAEIVSTELADRLTGMEQEIVLQIHRCGQHLAGLLNDILDYAKGQAGRIRLSRRVVELPPLVEECVTLMKTQADEAQVAIATQVDPQIRRIVADPLRVKQIVLNLLSNAVKHSPSGTIISVNLHSAVNAVLVSVHDQGKGMTPEELEHLFEPYYQAADQTRGFGTGIGLAITKLLVDLHGGTINIDSTPGMGSTFVVQLPLDNSAQDKSGGSDVDTWNSAIGTDEPTLAGMCEVGESTKS